MRAAILTFAVVAVLAGAGFAVFLWRSHRAPEAVAERHPIGTWCRLHEGVDELQCQLFDATGARWGTAVSSMGPLLLLVADERREDVSDPRLFAGLMTAVNGLPPLGVSVRSVTLPNAEPGGLRVHATKYDIYLDALGDVDDQLSALGVFLADRAGDKDANFSPRYIDLRTPGRVYYK